MSSSRNTSDESNPFFNRLDVDGEDGDEFIDHWDTGELLFLSSSVLQSDRNWVSVARSIKPYGESNRPPDWYTPKNCALQYTKLLDKIEDDSKKKALPRTERETPEAMLVKNLTEKRLKELELLNQQTLAAAETLRTQIEKVENGDFDDNLNELIKELDEQEEREKKHYNEYLIRRETLNKSKKLNKSRISRGKSPANISGLKKKSSVNQDIQKSAQHLTAEKINKNVKIDINEDIPAIQTAVIKTEDDEVSLAVVNPQLNSVVSEPSSLPQSSPLLTSLLSSFAFPSGPQNSSSISTSVRKPNTVDDSDAYKEEMDTLDISRECSPRHLGPKSPPSSDSSPLLNSLLKNSPSASAILLTSPGKEISPNTSSSRPIFNPTNASAIASAPKLVATSATLSQQIFEQIELPENHQASLQFFKATSACSAAPTLSKLLEISPSTSGKLPPLPTVDSSVSTTLSPSIQTAKDSGQSVLEFSSETDSKIDNLSKESSFSTNTSMLQKSLTSYSLADRKNMLTNADASKKNLYDEKVLSKKGTDVTDASQKSIAILEAVCESINRAIEEKERLKNINKNKKLETNGIKDLVEPVASFSKMQDTEVNKFCIGELSSSIEDDQFSLFEDINHTLTSSDRKYNEESTHSCSSAFDFILNQSREVSSDEGKKGSNSSSPDDSKSPAFKNGRAFERDSLEKMEMIQVMVPVAPRTYSRRGKRCGNSIKSIPVKQVEPEDQYEFSESTEENSFMYRTSNTLCYMPRVKEDFQMRDSKEKASLPMESEDKTSSFTSPSTSRKNAKISGLTEETSNFLSSTATGARFDFDERISDSVISEEASNQFLYEDKFQKQEETFGEIDVSKSSVKNSKCLQKVVEVSKKKRPTPVRSSRRNLPVSKGRKLSNVLLEELPTRCMDSKEMRAQNLADKKQKNYVPVESVAMDIKSNNSHLSSHSVTNKQISDMEECESPQGSITNVVSPQSANEIEGQESMWDNSEESEECESDNWDSQSASTNKSSSHSSETWPRLRRKERGTAEYKAWKKAINIVLREASCHKNANIFLQKVTDDVAPGYLNIVHRPMDLSLIKKNIDTGVIRTTDEFHRDMLLMFQNAIMYNSSDHDVHQMAVEMQRDVVKQISAFLATQSHDKEEVSEPSSLRGARLVKSHKRLGKISTAANSSKQKDGAD